MSNRDKALDIVLDQRYQYCIAHVFVEIATSDESQDPKELLKIFTNAKNLLTLEFSRLEKNRDWITVSQEEYLASYYSYSRIYDWIRSLSLPGNMKEILLYLHTTNKYSGNDLKRNLTQAIDILEKEIQSLRIQVLAPPATQQPEKPIKSYGQLQTYVGQLNTAEETIKVLNELNEERKRFLLDKLKSRGFFNVQFEKPFYGNLMNLHGGPKVPGKFMQTDWKAF